AFFMLGYTHARDRFFQMDYQRRLFSGRLAEMLGKRSLDTDIRMRTYGLRRAAEASLSSYSSETRSIFSAYADGVNAYLSLMRKARSLLPSEYEALELSGASIPDWDPLDTLTIAKGIAFQLSFDLIDINLTIVLAAAEKGGKAGGYDGRKFLFNDMSRLAPFGPSVSISSPGGGFSYREAGKTSSAQKQRHRKGSKPSRWPKSKRPNLGSTPSRG